MKTFDEVKLWVRNLHTNTDFELTLPTLKNLNFEFDYLIADVEDDNNIFHTFSLYEYQSLTNLNRIAEALIEIEDIDKLLAIYEAHGLSIDEILEQDLDNYILYESCDLKDYVYSLVHDGHYGEISDSLINYIDYECLARDLSHDGNTNETSYGLLIG